MALEKVKVILRREDPNETREPEAEPAPPLSLQGHLDNYYKRYLVQHHSLTSIPPAPNVLQRTGQLSRLVRQRLAVLRVR